MIWYFERAQDVAAEVRRLQGELGDFNMLIDRFRSEGDAEQAKRQLPDLQDQNQLLRQRVDTLSTKRQQSVESSASISFLKLND